ncbi:putative aromatic ring-opening dioxygenase subunit protein [Phaeoacremonium minimum UCRPA7]|uniref:Putative aromatic ring-opening dioxygenase subunit protein n=1 Tax=Phaeoacremonium minimum (strain UCR-PA7) TaxID=1286976 RepID=R8BIG6_PHAM7|nr:putative aromatic ring-opening dioxygenase subunit protein [Phaeoacremonium minimum UCRPA7]EON99032.1 putative aromatic ring-opening dioxygenase subunit protein [Phaeoacremonium minimum UCRPA7]
MFSSWTSSSSKAFAAVASFLSRRDYSTPAATTGMAKKTPVYFFSHGGPTVQYNTEHPVYPVLQEIGREITQKVKPKAVVVFSGHWQATPNSIRVNQAEHTDLIYDFYGFPDHYYKAKYPNRGSPQLASHVLDLLSQAGIKAEGVSRGLDHGVWAGFHVAFHPEENPLNVPLVQVSLYHSEDPDAHYRLGKAVAPLREEGVVIIGAGMSVHNLRELVFDGEPMPYSVSFDNALKEAAEAPPSERQKKMAEICRRPDAKQAHPWMDHLMPIHVAAGAAGDDAGKQTWTMQEGSFGWAQYRFGEVPSSQL